MRYLISQQTNFLSKFRLVSFYCAMGFILIACVSISSKGLNLALDFTGGYLTEFSTEKPVSQDYMQQLLSSYLPNSFQLTSADNGTYWSVRQPDTESSYKGKHWLVDFAQQNHLIITPQDAIYIGSQVGEELINQGGLALLTALIVILLYLSLRFEWRLAAGSVVALIHDVTIVLGIFSCFDIPFDLTIVASLLAIIGYSLNDSIIVGDKIREIMTSRAYLNQDNGIDSIINLAIKSTLVRTLITSGTTLATITAIWLFAGESLTGFSIALFTGVFVGTLSSIAISATLPQMLGLNADFYHKQQEDICQLP